MSEIISKWQKRTTKKIRKFEKLYQNPSDIYDKDQSASNSIQRRDRYNSISRVHFGPGKHKVKRNYRILFKNKFRELLLITSKGIHSTSHKDIYVSKDLGKLKYSVPEFIKTNLELNKFIVSINDAEKKDGGEGAIVIKLKNL